MHEVIYKVSWPQKNAFSEIARKRKFKVIYLSVLFVFINILCIIKVASCHSFVNGLPDNSVLVTGHPVEHTLEHSGLFKSTSNTLGHPSALWSTMEHSKTHCGVLWRTLEYSEAL